MLKIILQDSQYIHPFNERARDLRIQNKPLWLAQRDVLAPFADRELELPYGAELPDTEEPCLVYKDNLFFDKEYLAAFMHEAQRRKTASRAAFSLSDPSFREHALPLATSYTKFGNIYLADLWYYPNGSKKEAEPLLIDIQTTEAGYYHVPTYMAFESGDLVFQVPLLSMIAIDSWMHIFIADVVYGLFTRAGRFEDRIKRDPFYKLLILGKAMLEGKQVLECSEVVKIGHNCVIDPHAVIHGPTSIGNNVTIGAGAVIENCIIGDNVNVSQGCQLMLSVIGDGAFLPFRASLFMTTLMDNSMVAQNTCLQMCVVGRNTFIGAGSTFTDYNLLPTPIRAIDGFGRLNDANRPVLGGCVGHNCRLGAGMIFFPARTIESDVVLFASPERRVIDKDVYYEDSDHHKLPFSELHPRFYPRPGELETITW
jgi:UDP-N-acetylglucosamine diphosphorylase / glucose-1-phosphate thymidylyltransferase / UDP-N-acetylgalactosamine diphosphorylase / glucosamine-1-phosphate N-acetyltransferase / galactosamine-1-phosphate N-acetyltransferase